MKRHLGTFLGICCLVSLAPGASRAQPPAPASAVQLVTVSPNKVRYRDGEQGTVRVTLHNAAAMDQAVTLEGDLVQELALVTPLPTREVTVPGNKDTTLDLPFTAPTHEYGCAVRVRVLQGGKEIAQAQDMFNVADNVWDVAIGADLPFMGNGGSGTPGQNPPKDIETARKFYFNWCEKMFWAPDDWGNLTPQEENWFAGEGGCYESNSVIQAFTALGKAIGLVSVTYGKNTGGGPAGWEVARQHPDWFKQDATGHFLGTYNTDIFARYDVKTDKPFNRPWYYLYPDLTKQEALDHGIDEILNSALEFGWEGVRFDGDFALGTEELATYNQRRMKERIWAKLPNFVFGFNEGYGPPETDPSTWGHSSRETLARGAWMNEGIGNNDYGYATNGHYTAYKDYWQHESVKVDELRKIGASYLCIYYLLPGNQGLYKFVLGTSAGAHPPYGESSKALGCANWGRYLTRWSASVWDVNLRNQPEADLEVTAPGPLWHAVKERVADAQTKTTVVHLIVPPSTEDVHDAKVQVGPPVGPVTVRVRIPGGETVRRAAALAPEHPDEALPLSVTREGVWAVVTVPQVQLWTLVVFERAGAFTVPTYPKLTEPPDPAQVAAGRTAAVKLSRDPLRPDLPNPETGTKVQTQQAVNSYLSHAEVVQDPTASGGVCLSYDSTMSNSSVNNGLVFRGVSPGHYRVTYRLKMKATKDPAVWALLTPYVTMGDKQVWFSDIHYGATKDNPGFQTTWADFPSEFDFLGEGSAINVAAFWRGQGSGGTIYWDTATLEQLSTYSDAQIAEKLKVVPRTDLTPGSAPGLQVLVVNGLYNDKYHLPEALAQFGAVQDITPPPATTPPAAAAPVPAGAVRVTYATVEVGENTATLSGYPKTYEQLCAYKVVVLLNADATWFGVPGRAALHDFVNAGGGLLVLGGNSTLGQGNFANTFLEDMLPVTVAAGRDLEFTAKPLALRPAASGLARALPAQEWKSDSAGDPPACLYWRHLVHPKPTAEVQLYAGDVPVLLTGTYGRGRVAVFTGTVLGVPAGQEQPFWQWKGWPLLLHNTLSWLAHADTPQ
jgi:uncharacterized membrane protein